MRGIRTYTVAALLGAVMAAQAVALPHSPSQRAQLFATCAGRLGALEEHQRMFDGPASERTLAIKRQFEALLEAVMPDAMDWGMPGRMVWNWRVSAKQAQSLLLTRATFAQDPRSMALAQEASARYIAECDGIVLPPKSAPNGMVFPAKSP